MDAARHLTDPAPPWLDIIATARDVVGADSAALLMFDGTGTLLHMSQVSVDPGAERAYREYYHALDHFAQTAIAASAGQWRDSSLLYTPTQLRTMEYYVDFMAKYRIAQVQAFLLDDSPNLRAGISFQRTAVASTTAKRLEHGALAAYFQTLRAGLMQRKEAQHRQLLNVEAALSALDEAVCLASANGSVIVSTELAARWFAELKLTVRGGRLWHAVPNIREALLLRIATTHRTGQRQSIKVPTGNGATIAIDMAPAPRHLGMATETCVLLRMRREASHLLPDPEQLKVAFGITFAEARVLAALVAGQTAAQYATAAGVSVHTVRSQIATLMGKLQCSRQSQLVGRAIRLQA